MLCTRHAIDEDLAKLVCDGLRGVGGDVDFSIKGFFERRH